MSPSPVALDALFAELSERHGVGVADGLQVLAPPSLTRRPFDPGWPLVIVPEESARDPRTPPSPGFEPPVLPGRAARGADPVALLRALYPPGHRVIGLAGTPDSTVEAVTADGLASGAHFVPPLDREANVASPHGLPWLVARLRAPGGCPWDREQTHLSLRRFLLEEAYEVYDALEDGATPALAEELGDLLLQVVLHAHYAEEEHVFDLTDVYRSIMTKIVRRHPHVFGDVHAPTAQDVIRNWETIKAGERAVAERGDGAETSEITRRSGDGTAAAFAGLSRSLPALQYAQEIQERAASLGYDWPDIEGVIDKLEEETVELLEATDQAERAEEFGDLLLVVVNLGRKLGVDAEAALRGASRKFGRRFAHVERLAAERGVTLAMLSFEELDDLWREAKGQDDLAPASASATEVAG